MAYLVSWHLDGCPDCGDTLVETWQQGGVTLRCEGCPFEKRLPADLDAADAAALVAGGGAVRRAEDDTRAPSPGRAA